MTSAVFTATGTVSPSLRSRVRFCHAFSSSDATSLDISRNLLLDRGELAFIDRGDTEECRLVVCTLTDDKTAELTARVLGEAASRHLHLKSEGTEATGATVSQRMLLSLLLPSLAQHALSRSNECGAWIGGRFMRGYNVDVKKGQLLATRMAFEVSDDGSLSLTLSTDRCRYTSLTNVRNPSSMSEEHEGLSLPTLSRCAFIRHHDQCPPPTKLAIENRKRGYSLGEPLTEVEHRQYWWDHGSLRIVPAGGGGYATVFTRKQEERGEPVQEVIPASLFWTNLFRAPAGAAAAAAEHALLLGDVAAHMAEYCSIDPPPPPSSSRSQQHCFLQNDFGFCTPRQQEEGAWRLGGPGSSSAAIHAPALAGNNKGSGKLALPRTGPTTPASSAPVPAPVPLLRRPTFGQHRRRNNSRVAAVSSSSGQGRCNSDDDGREDSTTTGNSGDGTRTCTRSSSGGSSSSPAQRRQQPGGRVPQFGKKRRKKKEEEASGASALLLPTSGSSSSSSSKARKSVAVGDEHKSAAGGKKAAARVSAAPPIVAKPPSSRPLLPPSLKKHGRGAGAGGGSVEAKKKKVVRFVLDDAGGDDAGGGSSSDTNSDSDFDISDLSD